MSLRQWEEIQEVLPCYGAAWIDRPGGGFPASWPLDYGRPEFSKSMANALKRRARRNLALPGAEFLNRKLIPPAGCFKRDLTAVYCGHDRSLATARPSCDWRRWINHLFQLGEAFSRGYSHVVRAARRHYMSVGSDAHGQSGTM